MSKRRMARKLLGATVLLLLAPSALHAAPIGAGRSLAVEQARASTLVEPAANRGRYRRNGVGAYRRNAEPHAYRKPHAYRTETSLGFTYGNPTPESFPTGSRAWWEAMERWGRTGGR